MTLTRKESLERRLRRIEEELVALEGRPKEPEQEAEPTVVRFDLKYPDSDGTYSFAAIRIESGHWYTTAARSNVFSTWDDLLDELYAEGREISTIWVVTGYEAVQ